MVRIHRIDTQSNGLDVALVKFVLQFGGQAELGGAYWRKVRRVRKQNTPAVPQPLVKVNGQLGYFVFAPRSEEHTSELQSRGHLVCRLLLDKKIMTDTIQVRMLQAH